jgi:hypothetical protein
VKQPPLALDPRFSAEVSFNTAMSSAYFAVSDTTAQNLLFMQANKSGTSWGPAVQLKNCSCITP